MSEKDDFIVFGAPSIGEEEIQEVEATLRSGWLGTGPKVAKFEKEFAAYKGLPANQSAAVNSCTAALHVSMVASDLKPGDEVITTAMTFCATINSIIHAGLTPVLADIELDTLNISPASIEERITPKTRAILLVHFAGRPCEMDAIMALAEKHNLIVIEDCAHAIETEYKGKPAGTFGDFGCFSFYVTKNLATGEGGMVLAKDEEKLSRVKRLALHGMTKDAWHRFGDEGYKHYQVVECGFKYNMMDIQAALGIHQLARVEHNWKKRQAIWKQYQNAFKDLPVTLPAELDSEHRHAYHLYTVLIDEANTSIGRDQFLEAMTNKNIGIGVHYLSIPEHPYYQSTYGWNPEDTPNSTCIGRRTVSLPLSPGMTEAEVKRVIDAVLSVLG
ncbi:MAG: DegT/DnrJ/EryC1/StrS aminotransferase family protein [Pseudomonadales bacterium]|nr:DegT/DnrJ/EryC1/StrS aminotransferase family protein [Pseudomonadales bacterium]